MSIWNIQKELLEEVSDSGSGGGLKVEDIFESLSRSSDKDDKDTKDEDKDDKEEKEESDVIPLKSKKEEEESDDDNSEESEEDESEEDEEDEEETTQEDEDELELSKIPTRAQIKAKYPNIFKEFKALDRIFYREKEFAEVFPTVKDAKVARQELNEYGKIQEELLSGDVVGVLSRVKTTNPKAYDKIAGNIIESLIKVDKDSYIEPARVIIKSTLHNVYTLAANALKKDPTNKRAEQIQIAVELIHDNLFQTSEVTPYNKGTKEEDKENPEVEKLKRERNQIDGEKFNDAHNKVSDKFNDLVTKTLEKNIDPRSSLTSYTKTNLIKDIKEELDKQLISDRRFGGIVKKLYERARESNYSQASLDNIITALKNKAGSILPDIMRAKKGEALKGTSNVKKMKPRELSREDESESTSATTRNSRSSDSKSLTRNERRSSEKEEPQPGESALDYLNRKLG